MGGVIVANVLRQHGKAAWIVPGYKNGRPLWRWMRATFAGLAQAGKVEISKADQVITTHRGGFFSIYSEDNIDSARGEWFHVIVNDEAAKFREESRYDVIEPLVADSDGDIIDISTPRGRNWFWREAIRADGEQQAFFHAPTSDNPSPAIRKAAQTAKEKLPERSYRQEWLAEFVDDGGSVYRYVREAATAQPHLHRQDNAMYVGGIDWALSHDFTVFSIVDAATKSLVYVDRFNGVDYSMQRERIIATCQRFGVPVIYAESNAMGKPNNDELRKAGLPVWDFVTTNATKAEIVETLASSFERRDIRILDDPQLIAELESFESDRTPSGMTKYNAPDGMHDDMAMSLAIAWYGATNRVSSYVDFA